MPITERTPVSSGGDRVRSRPSWFSGLDRAVFLQYAVLVLIAAFVIAPIVPILYQSFLDRPLYEAGGILSADNYVRLMTDAGFGQVIVNTAIFAIGTTFLALVIAVPVSVVLVKTRVPFSGLLKISMQWPFFVSTLILGFGWVTLYGPAGFLTVGVEQLTGASAPWNLYSLAGMCITEAVGLAPIVYVFCVNTLRQSDSSLESAAQVCGAGSARVLWKVVIPLMRPAIAYSAVLVFTMAIETLSVPLLYGMPVGIEVFSTFLYTNGLESIHPDYGILGAASTIILTIAVVLITVQFKVLKNAQRFISVRGKATTQRLLPLGLLGRVFTVLILLYVVFGAALPILSLIFRSFTMIFTPLRNPFSMLTLANYEKVFSYSTYTEAIVNSLIVAGVGAVLVSMLALIAAVVAKRSTFRFRKSIEYLAMMPEAIPGIIVGIGFFWAFSLVPGQFGGLLNGTLAAIVIAFGLRALPLGFGSIAPAIMQIGQELDAAGRISGLDWIGVFMRILRKLLQPAFVGAMILVFVTMIKEYSAAMFLASAHSQVIGTAMLGQWFQGDTGAVAALVTIQIVIVTVFVSVASIFSKERTHA